MSKTGIPFCDEVCNPIVGCSHAGSPGCDNCWSNYLHDKRHKARKLGKLVSTQYDSPFSTIQFFPERLHDVVVMKKPKLIFMCSGSDLFHPDVYDGHIGRVFGTMAEAHQHQFIIITKRPERMESWSKAVMHYPKGNRSIKPVPGWPPNVIGMVTAENQETADERIPWLLKTPFVRRGVSVEPMLGPVDMKMWMPTEWYHYIPRNPLPSLDWVICGSESGPRRRPCDPDWIRSLRDQCVDADIPFFLKQMDIGGKLVKMPELDGKVWDQVPEGRR